MTSSSNMFLAGLAAGLASVVVGCAPFEDDAAIHSAESDLTSSLACFNAVAHRTATGSARFTANANFAQRPTCGGAYLLDLNDYHSFNNLGAIAMYGDTPPTTPATCTSTQVRVYVWSNNLGAGTFLGSARENGVWEEDHNGVGRCRVPHIILEHKIAGFAANGAKDFRIGMRAQETTSLGLVYRKLAFATVGAVPQTASKTMNGYARLKQTIDQVPAGQIATAITALWNSKSSFKGDVLCRMTQLDQTLKDFRKGALAKAGAPAASLDAQVTALGNMHTAFCTAGGTIANLQSAVRAYAVASLEIRDAIAQQYAVGLSTRDNPTTFADIVVQRTDVLALGKLISNCGLTPEATVDFLAAGILPAGGSASRFLLGSCSGSPAQLGSAMGMGASIGGQTRAAARAAFERCMAPPDAAGNPKDVCNDPRASGSASPRKLEDSPSVKTVDELCDKIKCTEAERLELEHDELLRRERAAVQVAARAADERMAAQQTDNPAPLRRMQEVWVGGTPQERFNRGFQTVAQQLIEDLDEVMDRVIAIQNYVTGVVDMIDGLVDGAQIPDPFGYIGCDGLPAAEPCQAMCAPDFLPDAWYPSGAFHLGSERPQLNKGNHLDHCLCKMHEAEYSGTVLSGFQLSSACPSDEDREKNECINDPSGPAGGIRSECFKHIFGGGDIDALTARYCQAQLVQTCPRQQRPIMEGPGRCGCEPSVQPSGSLPCTSPNIRLCTPDEPENCDNCQSTLGGQIPYASPTCRNDITRFPGAKDAWGLRDEAAMYVNQRSTGSYAAVRAGGTSIVTPTFFPNTFPEIGTAIEQEVVSRARPAAGENIDFQIYGFNVGEGIDHCYMGEVRLNDLTPNVPSLVTIELRPNCLGTSASQIAAARARILGSPFSMEYRINTPSTYKPRVEIGKWTFKGVRTATPSARLAASCDPPRPADPLGIVETFNPRFWNVFPGALTPENRTFRVSDGTFNEVPGLLFRIR